MNIARNTILGVAGVAATSGETFADAFYVNAESITSRCGYAEEEFCISSSSYRAFSADSIILSPASKTERKFHDLYNKWKQDIRGMSSMSQITSNKHYLRIIALGEEVIPCILKQLQIQIDPWFAALRALTEREDIGREHAGNFRKIAAAWIAWGKAERLI